MFTIYCIYKSGTECTISSGYNTLYRQCKRNSGSLCLVHSINTFISLYNACAWGELFMNML